MDLITNCNYSIGSEKLILHKKLEDAVVGYNGMTTEKG